jgi:hypothetical protein
MLAKANAAAVLMRARKRESPLGLAILAGIVCLAAQGEPRAQPDGTSLADPFDARAATSLVYGGDTWPGPDLQQRFQSAAPVERAYVRPIYDAAYAEAGRDKHVVIAALSPQEPGTYKCHACRVLIGGAVFAKQSDRWVAEAFNPVLGNGGGWGGSAKYSSVRIGRDHYAVLQSIEDQGGGYEDKYLSLFSALDGELGSRLALQFHGPGPGACGAPPQKFMFDVLSRSVDSEYWDLAISTIHNEGHCNELRYAESPQRVLYFAGTSCHLHERYRFADGQYRIAQTVMKQCATWPTVEPPAGMSGSSDDPHDR